jgi:hypothetical protein
MVVTFCERMVYYKGGAACGMAWHDTVFWEMSQSEETMCEATCNVIGSVHIPSPVHSKGDHYKLQAFPNTSRHAVRKGTKCEDLQTAKKMELLKMY